MGRVDWKRGKNRARVTVVGSWIGSENYTRRCSRVRGIARISVRGGAATCCLCACAYRSGWDCLSAALAHAKHCGIAVPNDLASRGEVLRSPYLLTPAIHGILLPPQSGVLKPPELPPGYATVCLSMVILGLQANKVAYL